METEKAEWEKRQTEFSGYIEKLSEGERTHFSFQREQEFWEVLLKGELDIDEMFGSWQQSIILHLPGNLTDLIRSW